MEWLFLLVRVWSIEKLRYTALESASGIHHFPMSAWLRNSAYSSRTGRQLLHRILLPTTENTVPSHDETSAALQNPRHGKATWGPFGRSVAKVILWSRKPLNVSMNNMKDDMPRLVSWSTSWRHNPFRSWDGPNQQREELQAEVAN